MVVGGIARLVLRNRVNRYTGAVLFENMRSVRLVEVHSNAAVGVVAALKEFHSIRERLVTEIACVIVCKSQRARLQCIYVSEEIVGALLCDIVVIIISILVYIFH